MSDTRRSQQIATFVMVALGLFMLGRCVVVWPQLPETVASHFDGRGVPNGFQSRAAFVSIIVGVQALLGFVFGVLPRILRHVSPKLINLPHRDYWLVPEHPERRKQALDRYITWSLWFGCFTFVLMIGIFELAIAANLTRTPMNPLLTWLLIGGYLLGTVLAIIRLHVLLKPPRG
jgi:uncharacterized membrane protein